MVGYIQYVLLKAFTAAGFAGKNMSAINCISIFTSPSPWQTSQRPPSTLNENADGFKPAAFAAGSAAYRLRISSQAFT
jgi:hypothetical protein